ncbi:hypothetical protein CLOM_g9896 [Closterium sp. NIES-68]|nr:hypothetical protein CLOM_g9896 [Closterium sp. NIES-68]GJP75910.1 hypothetical protein CLOP_g6311 [Closterium sp. NIES-67]
MECNKLQVMANGNPTQPTFDEPRRRAARSQSLGCAMTERAAGEQSPTRSQSPPHSRTCHRSVSASSRNFPSVRIVIPTDDDHDDDPCDTAYGQVRHEPAPYSLPPLSHPVPRGTSEEVDRLWEVHVSPSEPKPRPQKARPPKQSPLGSASGFARMLLQWAPSSARSSRRKKRADSVSASGAPRRPQSAAQSQSQRVADVSPALQRDTSASPRSAQIENLREPYSRPEAAGAEGSRGYSARPRTAPVGIFGRWRSAAPLSRPKSPLFGLTNMARRGVSVLPEGEELRESYDTGALADADSELAYNGDRIRSIFSPWFSGGTPGDRPWGGGWGVGDGAGESVSERGEGEREDLERRISYSSSIAGAAGSVVSSSTAAYTEVAYSESLIIQHTDDTDCESVTSASSGSGFDALAWGASAPMGGGNAAVGGGNAPVGRGNAPAGEGNAPMLGRNARVGRSLADGAGGDFEALWRSLPRDLRRTRSLQSPRGSAGGEPRGDLRGNRGHGANGNSSETGGEEAGGMRRVGSEAMLPPVTGVTGAARSGLLTPSAHSPTAPSGLPPPSPRSAGGNAWVVSVPSFAQHRLRVASAERIARGGREGRGFEQQPQEYQQQQQQQQQQLMPQRAHRRTRSLHSAELESMRLEKIGEFSVPSFQHSPSTLRPTLHSPSFQSHSLRPCPLRPRSPGLPPLSPKVAAGPSSVLHPSVQSHSPMSRGLCSPSPSPSPSTPNLPHRLSFAAASPKLLSPSASRPGRATGREFEAPLVQGHSLSALAVATASGIKANPAVGGTSTVTSTPRRIFRRCRSLSVGNAVGGSECDYSEASGYSHGEVVRQQYSSEGDGGLGFHESFSGPILLHYTGSQAVELVVPPVSVGAANLPRAPLLPLPLSAAAAASFPQAATAPSVAAATPATAVPAVSSLVVASPPVMASAARVVVAVGPAAIAAAMHVAPGGWVEDSYCLLKDEDGAEVSCDCYGRDCNGSDCVGSDSRGSDCKGGDFKGSDTNAAQVEHEHDPYWLWQQQHIPL